MTARARLNVFVTMFSGLFLAGAWGGKAKVAWADEPPGQPAKTDVAKEDTAAKAQPAGDAPATGADKAEPNEKGQANDKAGEAGKSEKGDEAAGAAEPEQGAEGEGEERMWTVGLDLVLGWGKVPFAAQNPAGNGASPQTPTYTNDPQTSSNVQSLLLAAALEPIEHLGFGVRVPFSFGTFNPNGAPSRSTAAFGNVEVEGEYGGAVASGLRLVGALGIAIPTGRALEIPDDLNNQPPATVDQSAYDRWSLAKAAAYARGFEENALFEPERLGIIPKVGLLYRLHGLSVEPYLKVENLIATDSIMTTKYVGELVGALRVGYWIRKEFELAARVWFNTGFAGSSDDKRTSVAVEPQVVFHFGPARPFAGLLVPLVGPPNENSFIGVRLGVTANF